MELKLNSKRTIFVGLAFMSIMLFWTVYDMVIAKMLVDNFGLNQMWSGVVMSLDNVFALFMLPLFGRISDKTKTKYGKRKPFILIGTIVAAVLIVGVGIFDLYQQIAVNSHGFSSILAKEGGGFYFDINGVEFFSHAVRSEVEVVRSREIFNTITKASPGLLVGFIIVLLFVLVAMGVFRSPAVSLMPDVTPKPLRSRGNAIINLMGTLGGGISYITIALLAGTNSAVFKNTGYVSLFAVTGALMLILIFIFNGLVKENKWVQEMLDITKEHNLDSLAIDEEGVDVGQYSESEKMPKEVRKSFILILTAVVLWFMGYNAATSKFSVYASGHLHVDNFSIPPLIGTVAAAIAFIPIGIISSKIGRRKMILIGIGILAASLGVAVFVTAETQWLIYVIMAFVGISWAAINVNSYPMVVEMSKHGNIGTYTGYYYTASMAAMIVTPILSGFIMDKTSYVSLFIYSAIFVALSFIPMFFVKHGEPVKLQNIVEVEEQIEEQVEEKVEENDDQV